MWRPGITRFGLKSLFVLITVCAYFSWQWSVSERRVQTSARLNQLGCASYRNSTLTDHSKSDICYGLFWGPRVEDPIRRSLLGSLGGCENRDGLNVFIISVVANRVEGHDRIINELAQLPGLSTVIVWDGGKESDPPLPIVVEFKEKLRKRLPHVKVENVHIFVGPA